MLHKETKQNFHKQSGFGLIELLVSISIVLLVTSIIMTRHTSYNGAVLLRSTAYEVALLMREVQLQAVSAGFSEGEFRNVYGVNFNTAVPNLYPTYLDANGNFRYDSDEVFGKQNNIDSRFRIGAIRSINSSGTETSQSNLSVAFERPNFDARFFDGSGEITGAVAVEIDIVVNGTGGSGVGEVRTIEVTRTGQISVQ
jgi:prepilin-type N-terminal cleavage/methylation domain-containing protein